MRVLSYKDWRNLEKINMNKIILVLSLLVSSATFASTTQGTVDVLYAHEHFSMIYLKGEAAKSMYDRLQVIEEKDVNGAGQAMGSFSKKSIDGRMWCQKIPQGADYYVPAAQGTYKCHFTFDSSTGEVRGTWAN